MGKTAIDQTRLQEVHKAVQDIWYSYAEGYLPRVTGTSADDELYRMMDVRMPKGWTVSIQPSGTVYASSPFFVKKSMGVLVVEKRVDGYQRTFQIAL